MRLAAASSLVKCGCREDKRGPVQPRCRSLSVLWGTWLNGGQGSVCDPCLLAVETFLWPVGRQPARVDGSVSTLYSVQAVCHRGEQRGGSLCGHAIESMNLFPLSYIYIYNVLKSFSETQSLMTAVLQRAMGNRDLAFFSFSITSSSSVSPFPCLPSQLRKEKDPIKYWCS